MLRYVDLEDSEGGRVSFHSAEGLSKIANADGLVGLPGVREVVRPRPNGSGSLNRTKRLTDRMISLQGETWGSSQEAAFANFDVLGGVLGDCVDTDRLLRWQRGSDGLELQQAVRLASDVKAPLAGAGRFVKWQLQLRASDPRAYSQELVTVQSALMGQDGGGFTFPATFPTTFEPGSAGLAVYTNAGDTKTPPVFRLYGLLVDPVVKLLPDGPEIALTGTVAQGDFLELDVAARTVKLNGATDRTNMRDFSRTRWFELPRGTGSVRLLATSAATTARLEVIYRHAYA